MFITWTVMMGTQLCAYVSTHQFIHYLQILRIYFHAILWNKTLLHEHKLNDLIDPQFLNLKGNVRACRASVSGQRRCYYVYINDNTTKESCMQMAFTVSPKNSLPTLIVYMNKGVLMSENYYFSWEPIEMCIFIMKKASDLTLLICRIEF